MHPLLWLCLCALACCTALELDTAGDSVSSQVECSHSGHTTRCESIDSGADGVQDSSEQTTTAGTDIAEGRNDGRKKKQEMSKLWPLLLIPFIIQALLLPIFLTSLKIMATKSILVGKVALLLLLFNVLRNAALRSQDDVYKDNVAEAHYGYNGGMEIGAWFNG